jgi:hypothetical protein
MIVKKRHLYRHLIGFFIAAFFFNPDAVPKAAAQNKCVQEMVEAREKYNNGDFSAAIAVLRNCLRKSGLTPAEKKQAYELLALIRVATDDTVQAKHVLQQLWKVAPNYNPNLVEEAPALFIRLALATRPLGPTQKKGGSKKWLWFGGAGVVAAGTAVVLLNGKKEAPPREFPSPPDRPPSK